MAGAELRFSNLKVKVGQGLDLDLDPSCLSSFAFSFFTPRSFFLSLGNPGRPWANLIFGMQIRLVPGAGPNFPNLIYRIYCNSQGTELLLGGWILSGNLFSPGKELTALLRKRGLYNMYSWNLGEKRSAQFSHCAMISASCLLQQSV